MAFLLLKQGSTEDSDYATIEASSSQGPCRRVAFARQRGGGCLSCRRSDKTRARLERRLLPHRPKSGSIVFRPHSEHLGRYARARVRESTERIFQSTKRPLYLSPATVNPSPERSGGDGEGSTALECPLETQRQLSFPNCHLAPSSNSASTDLSRPPSYRLAEHRRRRKEQSERASTLQKETFDFTVDAGRFACGGASRGTASLPFSSSDPS